MKEIHIEQARATSRMGHLPVEGGGLNAGYDTVDAVANICTTAGNLGMKYGKEDKYESFLQLAIQNNHKIKHTDQGKVKLIKERV